MLLNVMGRNCDVHTKNCAFLMAENGEWQLVPAYIVCHAYWPASTWVSKQSLSVNGKTAHINKDDLLAVAKLLNIKKALQNINLVSETVNRWGDYADAQKVHVTLRDSISKTLWSI